MLSEPAHAEGRMRAGASFHHKHTFALLVNDLRNHVVKEKIRLIFAVTSLSPKDTFMCWC